MTILGFLGATLLAAGALQGSGWLMLRAAGVPQAWALAGGSPLAWAVIGLAATLQPASGRPAFSLVSVGVVVLAVSVVGWLARPALRARQLRLTPPGPDRGASARMVALGVIAALLAAVAVMLWATGGDPRVASQTWDAPFHINAIRYAATTGIVSPDSIGAFVAPYATYYPSGFTAVGVVVMGLTGVEPVVASNITATLLAGSLWPGAVMVAGALGVRWRPAKDRKSTR